MSLPVSLSGSESDPSSDDFMRLQWTQWRDIGDVSGLPNSRAYYRIRRKGETIPYSIGACEQMIHWHFGVRLAPGYASDGGRMGKEIAYVSECREKGIGLEYSISPVPNDYSFDHVREMRAVFVLMHRAYREFCGHSPEFIYNRRITAQHPPVELEGDAGDPDWMGMIWTEPVPVGADLGKVGGFHILFRDGAVHHIGWNAIMMHGASWKKVSHEGDTISVAYSRCAKEEAELVLTDLLAEYMREYGEPPEGQFRQTSTQLY